MAREQGQPALLFELQPGDDTWTVCKSPPFGTQHAFANPLKDPAFVSQLLALRAMISQPTPVDPLAGATQAHGTAAMSLAIAVGDRLAAALLPAGARAQLSEYLREAGCTCLVLRSVGDSLWVDRALGLPWELLVLEAGEFPVRDNRLHVVREIVQPGGPPRVTSATEPLSVVACLAAPEGQTALMYEREALSLHRALSPLGTALTFTNLGELKDFVKTSAAVRPQALHFSGHGLPGHLLFEDEQGLSAQVAIKELIQSLLSALSPHGQRASLPRLFFLASCHGSTESVKFAGSHRAVSAHDLEEALGRGPSTASALHRAGFDAVVGYFGPIGDALCTRASETFYRALTEGATVRAAVAAARASLLHEIAIEEQRLCFPLAWAQLVLYQRGADTGFAPGAGAGAQFHDADARNEQAAPNGLPVLARGFIGRRADLHRLRRKIYARRQRLLVLQGLGGLGKTALASYLLYSVLDLSPTSTLVLLCEQLGSLAPSLESLCAQVCAQGATFGIAGWDPYVRELGSSVPDPALRLEALIRRLRTECPELVLYLDNVESLLDAQEGAAIGVWQPSVAALGPLLHRLAADGLVLASSRYIWSELAATDIVPIGALSPADTLRLSATFEQLQRLAPAVRHELARRVDGHPRTLEYIDYLLAEQRGGSVAPLSENESRSLLSSILPKAEARIVADLLLPVVWRRLAPASRAHAANLSFLSRPAPREVIEAVGDGLDEMLSAGLLTCCRVVAVGPDRLPLWEARWMMHAVVRHFVQAQGESCAPHAAHLRLGSAYKEMIESHRGLLIDVQAAIEHMFAARAGNAIFKLVFRYATFLRDHTACYAEIRSLLERCEGAGVHGDDLARGLMLQVQIRRYLGEHGEPLHELLDRAMRLAASDETCGLLLQERASLFYKQGMYADAERVHRESLLRKAETLGTEHPEYGVSLHQLAIVLKHVGRYAEAEELLRGSLAIKQKVFGEQHPDYAASLFELAALLSLREGNGASAAHAMLEQVLQIQENTFGPQHRSVAITLHQLANQYVDRGEPGKAELLLLRAMDIQRQALGEDNLDYGRMLVALGAVRMRQDRYEEALQPLKQAGPILQKRFSYGHPDYAHAMHVFAEAFIYYGCNDQAEELLRRALGILELQLGADSPTLCVVLNNLGKLCARTHRYSEGLAFVERAYRIARSAHGENHSATRNIAAALANLRAQTES